MTTPADAGFSILEAVVALAVVAFLTALVAQGFGQAGSVRRRLTEADERFEQGQVLRHVLERALVAATPPDGDDPASPFAFRGAASELSFAAPLPQFFYDGAPGLYHLALQRNGEWTLGYRIDVVAGEPRATDGANVVATEVDGLAIDYFGPVSSTQSGWAPDWSRRSLPQLIRFRWRQQRADHELLIRPAAARIDCSAAAAPFVRTCLE